MEISVSVCVPFMPIYGDICLSVYICPYMEISVSAHMLGPCICPYAHIWRSLYQSVSLLCLYTEISVFICPSVSLFYICPYMEIPFYAHISVCVPFTISVGSRLGPCICPCPYMKFSVLCPYGDLCICPYAHIWSSQSYAHIRRYLSGRGKARHCSDVTMTQRLRPALQ